MKDLDFYYKLFDFYVSSVKFNILNKKEFNELILDIKSNRGLKSRSKDELESFLINEFFKKEIANNLYLYGIRNANTDILDVCSTVSRASVFSYYTALYINELVESLPFHIFLNKERSESKNYGLSQLEQDAVDMAFSGNPRLSKNSRKYKKYTINLTSGQFQNNIGVINFRDNYLVSDLERTLIDCSVRPFHAGGPKVILKSYILAKTKLNTAKLFTYFSKMNFIYPYHQVIGFYLEKAGYSAKDYDPFLKYGNELKFYLDYKIQNNAYSEKWNLVYPKELEQFFYPKL